MQLFVRKKRAGIVFAKKPEIGSNGLIVEIINSIKTPSTFLGECIQRSEAIFIQVAVSATGDLIVAGDIHGNIFAIDLVRNRFNLVKHLSVPCSRLAVSLKKKGDILVALSDYSLRCYNIETQEQLACLRGHESSIKSVSIHSSKRYALTTSSETASLWNLDTYERKRKLSITKDIDLITAFFIPNSNSILTCFKDNSILVWDAESMGLIHELKSTQSHDVTYRAFACNHDGSYVAAAGKSNVIHIWDISLQRIRRVLQLPSDTKQIKQVEYLPRHLYYEDILAAVCSNGMLRFIDVKNSVELWSIGTYEHKVIQIGFAENGNTLACVMDSGNISVFDMEMVFKRIVAEQRMEQKKLACSPEKEAATHTDAKTTQVHKKPATKLKDMIAQRVENSKTLSQLKLREILREYGEFPEKYRTFIWKTVLKLPENFEAYAALLDKGIHPAYADIQKVYPIRSLKLLRVFQRLLSAVAYWAPVAVECTFLPMLAFPFAKLLQNNQLVTFEVVATVLLNWCQKWFDFIPNPPLNVLSLIENVFAYHDKELFQHFIKYRLTTQTYAWSLLQTGFSEVFPRNEWMKLWDHILINPPSWMLLAVVAYTLVNRGPLLDCYEVEEFKQFYRHHNGTGVSQVIKETYKVLRTTPSELDPANNLDPFYPLHTGQYQLLAKFPQRVKNFPQNEIDRIRKEQIELLKSDDMMAWTKR